MNEIRKNYNKIVRRVAVRVIKYGAIYDDDGFYKAIDDELTRKEDNAYVVANAIMVGAIAWGSEAIWDDINNMLCHDVLEDVWKIKSKE